MMTNDGRIIVVCTVIAFVPQPVPHRFSAHNVPVSAAASMHTRALEAGTVAAYGNAPRL